MLCMVKKLITRWWQSLTVLREYKAPVIALAVSALLHLLLISKFPPPAQNKKDGLPVMEVHLNQLKPLPLVNLSPTKNTAIKHQNLVSPTLQKPAEAFQESPLSSKITAISLDSVIEPQPLTTPGNQEPQASQPYKYIETDFEVHRNNALDTISATRIVFAMNKNESYKINRLVEARESGALKNENVQQTSEGMITGNGIQPSYFANRHESGDIEIQHADFAWSDRLVDLYSKNGKKTESVIDGMQDSISYMYQFMFSPPLLKNEITIADGREIHTYIYDLVGEDVIQTKYGELNVFYLKNINEREEKTELWLAKDYQNIPVKIRVTKKDGAIVEQTVIRINTAEPE